MNYARASRPNLARGICDSCLFRSRAAGVASHESAQNNAKQRQGKHTHNTRFDLFRFKRVVIVRVGTPVHSILKIPACTHEHMYFMVTSSQRFTLQAQHPSPFSLIRTHTRHISVAVRSLYSGILYTVRTVLVQYTLYYPDGKTRQDES